MYHVLFVICIYIPISCNAFGIKHYYFLVETNLCRFLKLFVYICIVIGDTTKSNKGGGGGGRDTSNRFNALTRLCLSQTKS